MSEEPRVTKFEEAVAELDSVVRRIDSGELSLEEALAAFEAGVALVRTLTERLNEAESRIDALVRSSAGSLDRQQLHIEDDGA